MRYQSLVSFQKHLADAAPDHLCCVYLILMSDDFERAKEIDRILAYLKCAPDRFNGSDCHLPDCLDAMQSMSLFGSSVVVLDEAEKLSKKEQEMLEKPIRHPNGTILLGARTKVPFLAKAVEDQGIVLDLTSEKPWDKEKRLIQALIERAKEAGKRVHPDVLLLIFERLGMDPALLYSEIDKLACYIGDRLEITREDVMHISPMSQTATLWQTAEKVIWEGGEFPSLDSISFHALLYALRNQLHLGLTLSSLIENQVSSDAWKSYLPKLFPKTLEKRSSQAARLGSNYFQRGLNSLFEIELQSRTHSVQYPALLSLFQASLYG